MSDETPAPVDAPPSTWRAGGADRLAATDFPGWDGATLVERTVTIDRPKDELYNFWSNPTNLALFMENIERIDVLDDVRSHWVVKGPGEETVEWDAVITDARDGAMIAWRSEDGAEFRTAGRVSFRDAPPGRGVLVSALILYEAPGGSVGRAVARLFQRDPGVQAHHDLRRFKQLMETGEIATSAAPDAAPRGC